MSDPLLPNAPNSVDDLCSHLAVILRQELAAGNSVSYVDQAFIGTLQPGESKTVVFRLDVDSDATPKDYGINSEIKYTDVNGDTVISESMKIPVVVNAASASLLLPAAAVIIVIVAIAGAFK